MVTDMFRWGVRTDSRAWHTGFGDEDAAHIAYPINDCLTEARAEAIAR